MAGLAGERRASKSHVFDSQQGALSNGSLGTRCVSLIDTAVALQSSWGIVEAQESFVGLK